MRKFPALNFWLEFFFSRKRVGQWVWVAQIQWVYIRVSQYFYNFGFFNVFISRQAHFCPVVPKQANFLQSLPNLRVEIENCARPYAKTVKIESSFFAERFIGESTTKNNIMYTLKKHYILVILSKENPLFKDVCKCAKTCKNHKI